MPARLLWREAFGRLTFDDRTSRCRRDTIFDLASLTKVLGDHAARHAADRARRDRARRSPRHIYRASGRGPIARVSLFGTCLSHSSGLPAWAPLFRDHQGREQFERAICSHAPGVRRPRTQSMYSDLGFMLLGFMLEATRTLAARFDALRTQMGIVEDVQFRPPRIWLRRTAPDGDRFMARPPSRRRSPRRERLGARWRRRPRRPVRDRGGCRPARASPASDSRRQESAPSAARSLEAFITRRATFRAARVRSAGTRCFRRLRAAAGCRREPSAIPGSPARRSGSIPIAASTSCCSRTGYTLHARTRRSSRFAPLSTML